MSQLAKSLNQVIGCDLLECHLTLRLVKTLIQVISLNGIPLFMSLKKGLFVLTRGIYLKGKWQSFPACNEYIRLEPGLCADCQGEKKRLI